MNGSGPVISFCRRCLRRLLQAVTVFYILAMGILLPYYYDWETDYAYIGSNKAQFFQKYGFPAGKLFLAALLLYGVFSFLSWLGENRGRRGKAALLINDALESLSATDKFALVYLVALCLSYYYTDYREELFLGVSGWYMGFLPQLVFIGSYFAVSRFLPRRFGNILPGILTAISTPVFLLGILNRYGYEQPGMVSSGPGYISTIGNINWFCGYWAVIFPLTAAGFVFRGKIRERSGGIFWGICCCVGFAAGLTQGSDSGILALAALTAFLFARTAAEEGEEGKRVFGHFLELLLLFGGTLCALALIQLAAPDLNNMQTPLYDLLVKGAVPWLLGIAAAGIYAGGKILKKQASYARILRKIRGGVLLFLGAALTLFVCAVAVNTLHPGSLGALSGNPLFVFNRKWGSSRGGTWSAGIGTWLAQDALHKVVGVGPDGMWPYIDSGQNGALLETVRAQFGDSRLTNAHGEWITVLADLGIFGLLGYGGMMVSAVWRFRKKAPAVICGVSLFVYTVHHIFSFQQTMVMTQVFLVLGLGEYLLRQDWEEKREKDGDSGEGNQNTDRGGR